MKFSHFHSMLPHVNHALLYGFICLLFGYSCKGPHIPSNRSTTTPVSAVKAAYVNDDSVHYIDKGHGTPVIFVHGTLGDYRSFNAVIDTFSQHSRIIAYSRRYAYPDISFAFDSSNYTVKPHADDLAAFIKYLGLSKVHLIGHSYGATIALQTALDYPHLVKSLVLGEPPIKTLLQNSPRGEAIWSEFETKHKTPAAQAFATGDTARSLEFFLGGVMGDTNRYGRIPQIAKMSLIRNSAELKGALYTNDPFIALSCHDVEKITQPVLLMVGEKSPDFFRTIIDELYRCLPNSQRVVLPNASHGLQNENRAEFLRVVLPFIAKH